MHTIETWSEDTAASHPLPLPKPTTDCLRAALRCAIEKQNRIGWTPFLWGHLSKQWAAAQRGTIEGIERPEVEQ